MTNPSLAAMNPVTVQVNYDNQAYNATFLRLDEAMDWIGRTVEGLLEQYPLMMASQLVIKRLS